MRVIDRRPIQGEFVTMETNMSGWGPSRTIYIRRSAEWWETFHTPEQHPAGNAKLFEAEYQQFIKHEGEE